MEGIEKHYLADNLTDIAVGFNESYMDTGADNYSDVDGELCCTPGPERIIVPVIFAVVVLLGCLGNTLVIVVVLKNKDHFRNTTNLFILNLGIADLLFLIFCVPFHAIIYTMNWPFGEFMCKFVHLVQFSSMIASILTLVAMSVDRFLAVGYALQTKHVRQPKSALLASVIIWIVSLFVAIPWPITYTVRVYDGSPVCADDWASQGHHKPTYFLLLFLFGFLIPLLVILVLSILMIRQLWLIGEPEGPSMKVSIRAKKKVTRLVIVVVGVFFLCWLPNHIVWIWTNYFKSTWRHTYPFWYFRIVAHVLSYTNSSMNPVIYAFLSSQFRKAFHRALQCTASRIIPSTNIGSKTVYSLTNGDDPTPNTTVAADTCL